jgi:hypothetical protein
MEIETITFRLTGLTDCQAFQLVESWRLGISEFEGLMGSARARRSVAAEWVVFCGWHDEASLQRFRRSELYARLALSSRVAAFNEVVESSIVDGADECIEAAA